MIYIGIIVTIQLILSAVCTAAGAVLFGKKFRRRMTEISEEKLEERSTRDFDKGVENIMSYSISGSDGFTGGT